MSLLFTSFWYIKDCLKINGKQGIRVPKKGEYVRFKNFERKIKSPFIIYADFKSILVPGDIQMSFILTNIKNMFLAVMATN